MESNKHSQRFGITLTKICSIRSLKTIIHSKGYNTFAYTGRISTYIHINNWSRYIIQTSYESHASAYNTKQCARVHDVKDMKKTLRD